MNMSRFLAALSGVSVVEEPVGLARRLTRPSHSKKRVSSVGLSAIAVRDERTPHLADNSDKQIRDDERGNEDKRHREVLVPRKSTVLQRLLIILPPSVVHTQRT